MKHPQTHKAQRFLLALAFAALAADNLRADPPPFGSEKRPAWTNSRVTGSPEPPLPYVAERVFPALKFELCLDIIAPPGCDRLFVVEQEGKIFSFPNQPDVAAADLVVDFAKAIEGVQAVYSLVFHPDFQRNRYCYVCYIKAGDPAEGTHVARFRMADTDPPAIDVASETTIITWLSGGHNGCCLKFGHDGCLYISTGDAADPSPPDSLKTGQDIGDLLSSILRIDVDHAEEGRNYRIPDDNPFVGLDGARGEVWAYGLRNPWRMSVDKKTGELWVGDVGWELWETLHRVERGGNYGWAVMEGRQPTNPEWPRGPTPILPPAVDHSHTESSSITDGLTYYGTRLPDLHGTHLYGDYDTGKLWGFHYNNGQLAGPVAASSTGQLAGPIAVNSAGHRELADTTHRIVSFGELPDGEFLLLDHVAGTIHCLVPNPRRDQAGTFPRVLSESGLFASAARQTPAEGVFSYSINAQPWADHALAQRYVAVPDRLSIGTDSAPWTFPAGSVLMKTLALDLRHGDPASRRLVETQLLHFDGSEWLPYTYQWNDEQTDAALVGAAGAERTFEVADPAAPGGTRTQTWRFSGRAECQRCHNKWAGPILAFNAPQLDKQHDDVGPGFTAASQLDALAQIGLLAPPLPGENRTQLADPRNASAELDNRARAYFQANCAHCHRQHAGGAVISYMHHDLPLDKTNMLGARPTQGTFGIHAAEVIAPGDPFRSVLLYRMQKLGGGRMPHIGSSEVDEQGVELIHEWLRLMAPQATAETTSGVAVATLRSEQEADVQRLQAADPAEQTAIVEHLLSSTSGALLLVRAVDSHTLDTPATSLAIERGASHGEVSIRDLFERFLPAGQRTKRLGSVVESGQILALAGDAARGKQVFFETAGVTCKNCHRIHNDGKEVGPELTAIGKKLARAELLESMLEPSKRIEPNYVTYLAETADGRILTGLLVHKDDAEVQLKDAQNQVSRIPTDEIEQLVRQQQSLMPDLLLRDMSLQQVADLLEYLGSLK